MLLLDFSGNQVRQSWVTLVSQVGSSSTTPSSDQKDDLLDRGVGLHLIVNVTAITAGGLVVTLQGKDPVAGTYYTVLASASIVGTGITQYFVYPGCAATANVSVNQPMPPIWRVSCVVTTGPCTYSVTAGVK